MTEPMPVRKIEASQLRRANRPTPPQAPPVEPPAAERESATPPPDPSPAPSAPVAGQRPPAQSTPAAAASKETARMSTYLDAGVRDRARAAYKATAHLENDRSWSAFVETALRTETARREQIHNDGQPFPGGDQPLSPGRPID